MILSLDEMRQRCNLDSDISNEALQPHLSASELQIKRLALADYTNATSGSLDEEILDRVQRAQFYLFLFFLIPSLATWQLRRFGMVSQEQNNDAAGSSTSYLDTSKLDASKYWRLGMQALGLPESTIEPGEIPKDKYQLPISSHVKHVVCW